MKRFASISLVFLLMLQVLVLPIGAAGTDNEIVAQLYAQLREGIDCLDTKIDISMPGLQGTEFFTYAQEAFRRLTDECPEYDMPELIADCQYVILRPDTYCVELRYHPQAAERRAALEAAVDEILSGICREWGEIERLLYLHDRLVTMFAYDLTYQHYSPYAMLETGTGVCEAYTRLMRILLNRLGFVSDYAHGEDHIWNIVQLSDGEWYHIDVTWDDPLPERTGQAEHTYFLVSDEVRGTVDGKAYPISSPQACTSKRFDGAIWHQSFAPFVYCGDSDTWYFLSRRERRLYRYDFAAEAAEAVPFAPLPYWTTRSNAWNVYSSGYSGLVTRNGLIYYNTPTAVCVYDPAAGTAGELVVPDTSKGYLVGLTERQGKLLYAVQNDPYDATILSTGEYTLPAVSAISARWDATVRIYRTPSGRAYCMDVPRDCTAGELLAQLTPLDIRVETRTGEPITDPNTLLQNADRLLLGSELVRIVLTSAEENEP